jgi:hypothetical protein
VRSAVLATLEPKRADKTIGSSLRGAPGIIEAAGLEGVDMAEICITSQATVEKGRRDESHLPERPKAINADRCWKVLAGSWRE